MCPTSARGSSTSNAPLPPAGWYWDFQANALNASPAERYRHGLPDTASFQGEVLFGHVHPDDEPLLAMELRALQQTGCNLSLDYRVVDDAGQIRHLHGTIEPVRDQQGAVIGAKGISRELGAPPLETSLLLQALDIADCEIYWFSGQGQLRFANARARSHLGFSMRELQAHAQTLLGLEGSRRGFQRLRRRLQREQQLLRRSEHQCADGRRYPVIQQWQRVMPPLAHPGPESSVDLCLCARPLTPTVDSTLQANAALTARLFESTSQGMMITDAAHRILAVNPAFTAITGYRRDEVLGKTPALLSSGRHKPAFYERMYTALRSRGQWQGEIWNRDRSGRVYPEWLSISAIRDARGVTSHYVGIFSNIERLKASEAEFHRLAHHDPLTGLPNRLQLDLQLSRRLAQAKREQQRLALLFIDLDRFKQINDRQGHAVGDQVLSEVARRLYRAIRQSDLVARLGGDEFIVIMDQPQDPADAGHLAQKLLDSLVPPLQLNTHQFQLAASIGISLYPQDATDSTTLIHNADRAMYRAKARGRNHYEFFRPPSAGQVAGEPSLSLRSTLRRRLSQMQLRVFLRIADGQEGGWLVEESWPGWMPRDPLLAALSDRLTTRLALRAPLPAGTGTLWLPLCAEPTILMDHLARIAQRFSRNSPGQRLGFLLRERPLLEDSEQTVRLAGALADAGIGLGLWRIDQDLCALRPLLDYPLELITLSPALVHQLGQPQPAPLAQHLIELAHHRQIPLLAEHVSREAELHRLRRLGCDFYSGPLAGPPSPLAP